MSRDSKDGFEKSIATHNKLVREVLAFVDKRLKNCTKWKLELEGETEAIADWDQTQVHTLVIPRSEEHTSELQSQ